MQTIRNYRFRHCWNRTAPSRLLPGHAQPMSVSRVFYAEYYLFLYLFRSDFARMTCIQAPRSIKTSLIYLREVNNKRAFFFWANYYTIVFHIELK